MRLKKGLETAGAGGLLLCHTVLCCWLRNSKLVMKNEKRKKKEHTIGQNDTSVCVIWAMDTVEVRDGEHECESASCCITEMGGVGQ